MSKPLKPEQELIALAMQEISEHLNCPPGLQVSVVRDNGSWEFRASGPESAIDEAGYAECVAMLVQIGDRLSKEYDVAG